MKKLKFKHLDLSDKELKIVEKSKIWFMIPVVIILIALIVFFSVGGVKGDLSQGLNVGIDFEGGSLINIKLGNQLNGDNYAKEVEKIEKEVESHGVHVSYRQKSGTGEDAAVVVRYKNIHNDDTENNKVNREVQAGLKKLYPNLKDTDITYESIGSTASSDLVKSAVTSILVSALLILIYVIIRFDLWGGVAAIVALIHDLTIMFALTVICQVQINSSFIAALITILAYSINDTIVVFDRVREAIKMDTSNKIDYTSIANKAITATLTRSIYTSITTLLTIICLAIFGVSSIREFALPIVFGILAGTFSSIFLATPLYVMIKKSLENSKRNKLKKAYANNISSDDVQQIETKKEKKAKKNIVADKKMEVEKVEVEKVKKPKKPKKSATHFSNPKKNKKSK